ncbi:MAG: ATP-binding protein [Desulfobacterota bacterium]|jgi:PAS domain S-box-containing protein|nr:ATP-binding protein [Thermodesulfobacteriota bacterium]
MIQKLLKGRRFALRLHIFLILLICGLLSCPVPTHAQAQPQNPLSQKNVLILHALESNVPIFELTDRGLRAALDAGGVGIRNQFLEYLDLARNPGPEHIQRLAELLRLRYGHRKIDVIITLYPEALRFVLNEGRVIFPDVPILGLYMPPGIELPKTERRIIQHLVNRDVVGTLEIALNLVPDAKRVFVVSGAHELDRKVEDLARGDFKKWEGRLEFRYLSNLPLDEILAAVSSAPPETIVFFMGFAADVTGKNYTTREVGRRLEEVSRVPVFGLYDVVLGYGIAGGSLISFEYVGTRAGELALDILRGNPTTKNILEFLDVPPLPMFDWRQLRHWNLSESALPKGSIVINKEPTLWDFKYYLISGLAFIVAQFFLIAGLLVQKRRKRVAEESLRQKTEELDQFFTVSLDLLCIANTEGYFLRLNPSFEKVLGYSGEELTAKQFLDFVHPEDLARTRDALFALASQRKVLSFQNRYRCKDGTYRWLEWTSAPAGNLIYSAARDITGRLKTEAEAVQRRQELAHVSRIATMGELTTSLAHEINQPLTAILSNAEAAQRFLSQAEPDTSEVRQILEDIVRDDRRASDVVRKVRTLVKKEKPGEEILNLNDTIQEVLGIIKGESLLPGLSITMELSPELKMVRGDRIQLEQVILNLILNSAAAMKDSPQTQRKITVKTAMADSAIVETSVTDFGTGIDESNIERLFEPFYTTKPEGLGMGLSISQTIIKAHGGTIEARNNPEGGATFAFTLPAHQGDSS